MGLTMTAEREAEIRAGSQFWKSRRELLAELDAERAKERRLVDTRDEYIEWASKRITELNAELDAERAAHQETQAKLDAAETLRVAMVASLNESGAFLEQIMTQHRAELAETQAIVRELLEALEPFADQVESVDASGPGFPLRVGGCRADWNQLRMRIAKAKGVLPTGTLQKQRIDAPEAVDGCYAEGRNLKPLCIDLFCGLGGWSEGFLAEGYDCIGFDIERHDYGTGGYPGQLVLQDVLTLHGSQFKDAAVIVASPPCQAYSYRAMPWKRAKALPPPDNTLFEACFRIQREANEDRMRWTTCRPCDGTGMTRGCCRCEICNGKGVVRVATGDFIPLVVENVKGAQPWVGRARWHYGSFYLWGDVPALMPSSRALKVPGFNFHAHDKGIAGGSFQSAAVKVSGLNWSGSDKPGYVAKAFNDTAVARFGWRDSEMDRRTSHGKRRKAASAQIAKIPLALSTWIAKTYKPAPETVPACAAPDPAGQPNESKCGGIGESKAPILNDGDNPRPTCAHCDGTGKVQYYHGDFDTCPTCHGSRVNVCTEAK